MNAQSYAIERLRDLGNATRNNAIRVIRELIEDHKVENHKEAVMAVGITFGLGMNDITDFIAKIESKYGVKS